LIFALFQSSVRINVGPNGKAQEFLDVIGIVSILRED